VDDERGTAFLKRCPGGKEEKHTRGKEGRSKGEGEPRSAPLTLTINLRNTSRRESRSEIKYNGRGGDERRQTVSCQWTVAVRETGDCFQKSSSAGRSGEKMIDTSGVRTQRETGSGHLRPRPKKDGGKDGGDNQKRERELHYNMDSWTGVTLGRYGEGGGKGRMTDEGRN